MEKFYIYINKKLVCYEEEPEIIEVLKRDDTALMNYVSESITNGEVEFVGEENHTKLVITRTEVSSNKSSNTCIQQPQFPLSQSEKVIPKNNPENKNSKTHHSENTDLPPALGLEIKEVWVHKGKPSVEDEEAIQLMLEIRASDIFVKKFSDKKSVKLNLWRDIAKKLSDMGFNVDGEKCRQKFSNLQKQYMEFIRHVGKTGGERRDPPKFYDLLHIILGAKDKVTLRNIEDTLNVSVPFSFSSRSASDVDNIHDYSQESNNDEGDRDINQPSTSKSSRTPSSTPAKLIIKNKLERPQAISKHDIYSEIKSQGEKQDAHMLKFCSLIEEQNKQRAEFISIMKDWAKNEPSQPQQKRKRRSRSSDNE